MGLCVTSSHQSSCTDHQGSCSQSFGLGLSAVSVEVPPQWTHQPSGFAQFCRLFGQGLFTAVICLTFSKGWVWGSLYKDWQQQRLLKKQKSSMRQYRLRYSGRHSPSIGDLDQLENGPTVNVETQPLLYWPFSHPDRAVHERQHTRTLPDRPADPSQSEQYGSLIHHATIEPATSSTAFLILWPSVEKWLWVDIFVWVRRVIGVVSLLGTVLAVVLVVIATVWDRDSPRFLIIKT